MESRDGLAATRHRRATPRQYQRAADRLTEGLALLRDVDHIFLSLHCMDMLAAVFAARDKPIRAARLFGAVEALRERAGLSVMYPQDHERGVAAAKTALGEKGLPYGVGHRPDHVACGATELALKPADPAALPAELTARPAERRALTR